MSYEPHTWVSNETITAAKLNAMEQGIANGGGGYDAEISITDLSNGSFSATVTKGSFTNIASMIQNNVAPNILVRVWSETSTLGYTTTATSAVAIYVSDFVSSVPYITFVCKCPTSINTGTYTAEWYRFMFTWFSDDTIEV